MDIRRVTMLPPTLLARAEVCGSMLSKKSAARADVLRRWFGVASCGLIGLLASPGAGVDLDADATNQRDATHIRQSLAVAG